MLWGGKKFMSEVFRLSPKESPNARLPSFPSKKKAARGQNVKKKILEVL